MYYLAQEGDQPPPQDTFLLELSHINTEQAILTTLDGKEANVSLKFQLEDLLNPVLQIGPPPYPACALHVKDLGRLARGTLGMNPTTPLYLTTRITYHGNVLPMHRPLATLLDSSSAHHQRAHQFCHFCGESMRGCIQEGSATRARGPYEECWFCLDQPSWHHGRCCPHNPESEFCDGTPHHERYRRQWLLLHT